MSDEKVDEKQEETQSESSTDKIEKENVTEDEKKSEDLTIPKERFDEVNAKYKALKEKVNTLSEKKEPKQETANEAPSDKRFEWMEFTIENRELDKEQLVTAKRLYEAGVPLDKVLEDPLYVAFSEQHQKQKVEEGDTPTPNRGPKVTPEKPVEEMTRDEHAAHFKKMVG